MAAETKIRINKIPPYDGEYELDWDSPFTSREWRWVRQISGCRPMTMLDALGEGDPDVVIAVAVVAMHRAGKINRDQVLEVADRMADAPFDGSHIDLELGTEEDDAGPPELTSVPDGSSPSGSLDSRKSSGVVSTSDSVRSDNVLKPIGTTR